MKQSSKKLLLAEIIFIRFFYFSLTTNSEIPFESYEAAYEEEPEEDRKFNLKKKTLNFCFFSCSNGWDNHFTYNLSSKNNTSDINQFFIVF
jgi:hypothetical protein